MMCNANGPSTPGLRPPLAKTGRPMLPASMHTPWAESNRNKDFGAPYRSGRDSYSLPFVLATFLCTLGRGCYQTRCNTRYRACGSKLPWRDSHPLVSKPFPVRTFSVLFADVASRDNDGFGKSRSLLSYCGWAAPNKPATLKNESSASTQDCYVTIIQRWRHPVAYHHQITRHAERG